MYFQMLRGNRMEIMGVNQALELIKFVVSSGWSLGTLCTWIESQFMSHQGNLT